MTDHTLFFQRLGDDIDSIVVYVDDMIVMGRSPKVEKPQSHLAKEFEMKGLGTQKYFLGIELFRSKHKLFLSQRKYTLYIF